MLTFECFQLLLIAFNCFWLLSTAFDCFWLLSIAPPGRGSPDANLVVQTVYWLIWTRFELCANAMIIEKCTYNIVLAIEFCFDWWVLFIHREQFFPPTARTYIPLLHFLVEKSCLATERCLLSDDSWSACSRHFEQAGLWIVTLPTLFPKTRSWHWVHWRPEKACHNHFVPTGVEQQK